MPANPQNPEKTLGFCTSCGAERVAGSFCAACGMPFAARHETPVRGSTVAVVAPSLELRKGTGGML